MSVPKRWPVRVPASQISRMARCGVLLMLSCALGCASVGEPALVGEQASYHVFNDTGGGPVYSPRLSDGEDRAILYANLQSAPVGTSDSRSGSWVRAAQGSALPVGERSYPVYGPFGRRLAGRQLPPNLFELDPSDEIMMLPRVLAGAFHPAQPGHRIPAVVTLQWRLPATPGQDRYHGDPVGPFRLVLRASIPPAVLRQLSQSWRHRLELAIGASTAETRVFWRLRQMTDHGARTAAQGSFWAVRLTTTQTAAR